LSTVDLNLVNAKVLTEGGFVEAGISVEAGRIQRIAKAPNLPRASETVDAGGNVVLPGLIDAHVHLRDMELAYKEDFYTGTCAAAAGGFTTVLDMPNTEPPTNTPQRLREKAQRARDRAVVNVGLYAAFPPRREQFAEMAEAGAVAFKVYLYRPVTELDVHRDDILLAALRWAREVNRVVAVHAEEGEAIRRVEEDLRASGRASLGDFLRAHSARREINSVRRVLGLAEEAGSRVHLCHVSAASSLGLLERSGARATCEVTPYHLFLTAADLRAMGPVALSNPPPRSRLNASRLWRAVREGRVDIVASDHAPHSLEEKRGEDVWRVRPGVPGLETTLPLMLTEVGRGRLSWARLVRLLAAGPGEVFRLGRGSLREGGFADMVVVDADRESTIDPSRFHSKAHYTPFEGRRVRGVPVKTFVNGRLVMDEGEIVVAPGSGRVLGGER